MTEYQAVIDHISTGCFTIDELCLEFPQFTNKEEFKETLEGYAAFGKFKQTREYFHGNDIPAPEKKVRQKNSEQTGNSLDCTEVNYPEWVKTDRDKVKYLTSEEAPQLPKPMHFFIDDVEMKTTGRLLSDSLNSNHIMTSVYMSPRTTGGNRIDFSKDVTQARGFSVLVSEKSIKISASLLKPLRDKYANATHEGVCDHFEKEFTSYSEFKNWMLENL